MKLKPQKREYRLIKPVLRVNYFLRIFSVSAEVDFVIVVFFKVEEEVDIRVVHRVLHHELHVSFDLALRLE